MTLSLFAALLFKMALVSAVVVVAAMAAERTRPALAALIATLPFSIGPTYVLLALQHDAAFLRGAALVSVAGAGSTIVFIAAYAHAIMRLRPVWALVAAYAAWLPAGITVYLVEWTMGRALLSALLMVVAGSLATAHLRAGRTTRTAARRWWDIPLRAFCVASLVGGVTGLSALLGPTGTGTLANFPIVMSSVGIIMHLRLGAAPAAAMLASAMGGMAGICVALLVVHLTMGVVNPAVSLLLGLAVTVGWNLILFTINQREFVKKNKAGPVC